MVLLWIVLDQICVNKVNVYKIKRKIVLNLVIFLSGLVFVEICYRIYIYIHKPIYSPSSVPNLGWYLTPRAKIIEYNKEGIPIEYAINSSGFRDKTNGNCKLRKFNDIKIAFVGDSITYGIGVNYENVFSSVVETYLSKIKLKSKTINLGISGYNTLQQLAILEYKAIPLNPDVVILAYFLNDIERRKTQMIPNSLQYFLRYFHFGVFLLKHIATVMENSDVKKAEYLLNNEDENIKKVSYCNGYANQIINSYNTTAWEDNKKIILSMKNMCIKKGIKKFAVVVFPFKDQVEGICPATPQNKISKFLSDNEIPFLDITEVYRIYLGKETNKKEMLYWQSDNIHPNARGHIIAGEAISEWFLSEFFLDNSSEQQKLDHEKLSIIK